MGLCLGDRRGLLRAMSSDPRSRAWAAWLMAGCYGLWLLAWTLATPLFSGADEWAHYLRAVGIREGRLVGERVPEDHPFPDFTPAQQSFLRQTSRFIDVPAGMMPRGYACNAFVAEKSAGCLAEAGAFPEARREVTVTGAYPPAFYLLPAAAMLPAQGPGSALWLARLANLLVCVLLLALALRALAETPEPAPALAAFAVALTPMGLSTMAVLSPSGPEESPRGSPSPPDSTGWHPSRAEGRGPGPRASWEVWPSASHERWEWRGWCCCWAASSCCSGRRGWCSSRGASAPGCSGAEGCCWARCS